MSANFFITLPGGQTISAMQHPDPRTPVQKIFQDFNPASGQVSRKKLKLIDCSAGTPLEQGITAEERRGRIQLLLNHNGGTSVVLPVPDANGKTANLQLPMNNLAEFGQTLIDFHKALKNALAPENVKTSEGPAESSDE